MVCGSLVPRPSPKRSFAHADSSPRITVRMRKTRPRIMGAWGRPGNEARFVVCVENVKPEVELNGGVPILPQSQEPEEHYLLSDVRHCSQC